MAQHDKDMEDIDEALGSLAERGRGIGDELTDQNELIGELNKDVEATQNTMDKVNSSLQKILQTQDGCQLGVVIAMAIACVISVALLASAFF